MTSRSRRSTSGSCAARWRDLGSAAGSFRAGVSLIEIAPGARSTPVHAHADEEELFYVLDGDGRSWQDGQTFAIEAGDCLLHRVHEESHTLIAGERGLTVLAFGPRAATNITWLGHARVMRVGPHFLPHDVGALRRRSGGRTAAGPGCRVARSGRRRSPRWPTSRPLSTTAGASARRSGSIGRMLGAETTGMRHVRIAPGAHGTPHHCHGAEEELFVVLGGAGEVRLGDERFAVRRGSVVARPPGTGVAHSFIAGPEGLELLGWGTTEPNDIAFYPDSGKVYLCGVGVIGRLEPCDYWDGEE